MKHADVVTFATSPQVCPSCAPIHESVRGPLVGIRPELGRDLELHEHLGKGLDRGPEEVDVAAGGRVSQLLQQCHPVGGHRLVSYPADVRHLLEDHAVALAVKGLDLHHLLGHYSTAKRDQADMTGPVFTIAHLVPFQPAEQRDLRDLFGVDLGPGKRKAGGAKPIAKSDEKKAAKPAIMLTYTPMAFRVNPAASKEIRAFLEQRTEHKPAGVPLLVVIRPVN